MKRIALSIFLLLIFLRIDAQTTLSAGDMAIIGINLTTNKVRFVTFKQLDASTVVYLTDYGWENVGGAFASSSITAGEGLFKWIPTATVAAGTVFEMTFSTSGSTLVYSLVNLTTNANITTQTTIMKANGGDFFLGTGENFFIYQGGTNDATYNIPIISPRFICGFNDCVSTSGSTNIDATGWSSPFTSGFSVTSSIPTSVGTLGGLTNGTNAIGMVAPKRQINAWYTGPTTAASAATWATRINDVGNWSADATSTVVTTLSSPISILNPLPVVFTGFTVAPGAGNVLLSWRTGAEENVAYFDVQRSTDGVSFTSIAKVNAAGFGNSYSYTDHSCQREGQAKLFYRIENADHNGATGYSKTLSVLVGRPETKTLVFPNPVSGNYINILAQYGETNGLEYKFYSAIGQIMLQGTINENNKISISGLLPGVYYLKLSDGTAMQVQRL